MKMQINAQKIKQLREQRCWSQLQMAEMAGISLRTLQRVEAKSVASQETIKGIASVLDIDCESLLPETNDTTPLTAAQLEQPVITQQSVETTQNPASTAEIRKQFLITLTVIIVSAAIGFAGVFIAYSENRIDQEQFVFFKDLVAGGFLLGLLGLAYRAYKADLISLSKFH
ncbi:helix-turn-helix transcriptional regulator [Aliiglaciecola litoralis]|uniref:HTH cro/C1-type domain-containing protein n=1 Tax=Aliiglaciecola litoralis TaxID=582857 RepID=A0ABP3WSZ5_9ALTE